MENRPYRITSFFCRFFEHKAIAAFCFIASALSFVLAVLFPEKSCFLCRFQRIGYVLAAIFACLLIKKRFFHRYFLCGLQLSLLAILLAAALQGFIHAGIFPEICVRNPLRAATTLQYIKSIRNVSNCSSHILTLWAVPLYFYSGALALFLFLATFFHSYFTQGGNYATTSNTK